MVGDLDIDIYNPSIPKVEKENYTHSYTDQLRIVLTKKHIIPFDPNNEKRLDSAIDKLKTGNSFSKDIVTQ